MLYLKVAILNKLLDKLNMAIEFFYANDVEKW